MRSQLWLHKLFVRYVLVLLIRSFCIFHYDWPTSQSQDTNLANQVVWCTLMRSCWNFSHSWPELNSRKINSFSELSVSRWYEIEVFTLHTSKFADDEEIYDVYSSSNIYWKRWLHIICKQSCWSKCQNKISRIKSIFDMFWNNLIEC